MPSKRGRVFSEKHGPDAQPDPVLAQEVQRRVKDRAIPCAVAFELVHELNVAPSEVGRTADLLDISISKCQLGLFGYNPDNKIIEPENSDNPDLVKAIKAGLKNERLPCTEAWAIADRYNLSKLELGNVVQASGIKIKFCQLGAF